MKVWIIEEHTLTWDDARQRAVVFVTDTHVACVGWLGDHNIPHHLGDSIIDGQNITVEPYGDEMLDDRQIRIVADNGDVWFVTCYEVK